MTKPYSAPAVTVLGSLEALTLFISGGGRPAQV